MSLRKEDSTSEDETFSILLQLSRRIRSATGSQLGASAASVVARCDDHVGNEVCTDMLVIISGGLEMDKKTGRKCENKWLVTSEIYFYCNEIDAAAPADMHTVRKVSAG